MKEKGKFIHLTKTCDACKGKGHGKMFPDIDCISCNGTGKITTPVNLDIMELFMRRQVDKFRRKGLIPPKDEDQDQE